MDDLGSYVFDLELRLREFLKSLLTEKASSWYANLQPGSIKTWDEMVAHFCSKFFIAEEKLSIADLAGERPKNDEPLCEYVQRFREKALDCSETIPEKDLVKLCIKGMFAEYRVHIENHAIHDFAVLSVKARNTEASASKLARLMRNHGDSSRQLRKEGKRGLEVAIAQDYKKGSRFFKKEKTRKAARISM